ncbi:hypothetical protein OUZ56_027011 [Daphnia magna]|uniref:Uncharacterized protein n=1 Tax=Daphnia magna TaxID=35525 RepID=A0ABQ9ZNH2_9CRUS|nr:hypothetical protein OUZ56_027011 [Daphnia magna]
MYVSIRAVSSRVVFKLAITRNIRRCWGHSYCVVTLKQGRAMLRMMLRNLPRTYRKHKLAHLSVRFILIQSCLVLLHFYSTATSHLKSALGQVHSSLNYGSMQFRVTGGCGRDDGCSRAFCADEFALCKCYCKCPPKQPSAF